MQQNMKGFKSLKAGFQCPISASISNILRYRNVLLSSGFYLEIFKKIKHYGTPNAETNKLYSECFQKNLASVGIVSRFARQRTIFR